MKWWLILIIFCLLFLVLNCNSDNTEGLVDSNEIELFERLMENFKEIFPDRNRNSGGVQFFDYILNNLNPTINEFILYNRFYCSVSGSPIDPGRENRFDLIKIKDLEGNEICGNYYRCCIPCNCDIMKYGLVENMTFNLSDGEYSCYVITIPDPCKKEDEIPKEVSSFECSNSKTLNGVHSDSGRLITGLLHDAEICTEEQKIKIKESEITGPYCDKRNSLSFEEIKGGMGDIFVKLASLTNEDFKGFYDDSIINSNVITKFKPIFQNSSQFER